jgi:hypothetical protein
MYREERMFDTAIFSCTTSLCIRFNNNTSLQLQIHTTEKQLLHATEKSDELIQDLSTK